MAIMTADLVAIAAAVDAAVPERTTRHWACVAPHSAVHLVTRPVHRMCGERFGHLLQARALPTQATHRAAHPEPYRDGGITDAVRSAFRGLGTGSADTVFVRVTAAFLAGDLPIPLHPERVVVEVDGAVACDAVVLDGMLRLKALGCRVSLSDFTGRPDQRRALPFADFVKVDARDLDVEGAPLLALATSRGAELVADFVDTPDVLQACRAAGFAYVQGRAVEECRPGWVTPLLSAAGR